MNPVRRVSWQHSWLANDAAIPSDTSNPRGGSRCCDRHLPHAFMGFCTALRVRWRACSLEKVSQSCTPEPNQGLFPIVFGRTSLASERFPSGPSCATHCATTGTSRMYICRTTRGKVALYMLRNREQKKPEQLTSSGPLSLPDELPPPTCKLTRSISRSGCIRPCSADISSRLRA